MRKLFQYFILQSEKIIQGISLEFKILSFNTSA